MQVGIAGIIAGTLIGVLQAQTVDLKGRVVQANGTPVADATVDLKVRGTSVKTGADGTFAFNGNVGLTRAGMLPFTYRLEAGFLSVAIIGRQDLRVEVLDGAGRLQGVLDRRLEEGSHRIALAEALPASGAESGLYFLRMRLDGETLTHPFFHSGNGSVRSIFAPAYRMAAAKRSAAVDTLRVRKAGFQDIVKEIASYSAGNLGDLTLAPASTDGWVNLFNGKDLTGWVPLIHKSKVGENYMETFRADSVNKVIRIAYDKYPNQSFDNRIGNLYYNRRLTNYRVRVTYRFIEPQAKNPVSWGKNNSALMIFAIDPHTITGDPQLAPMIEIQLLGNPSGGGTTSPNYCELGGVTMQQHSAKCGNNGSGKAPNPANQWTTVEAEVHVTGVTKVFQLPDTTNPAQTMSGPRYMNQPLTGGFIALQSESQPLEFKDILLKELPQ
jgi:hypothetical protein